MARKYARDNRGRFAPKGAGATARGGRLKTAGGNKRETQKRMIFSPESRRLAGAYLDASAKSGKINMPVRFGGEGAGYKTPRGRAAAAASKAASNAYSAEKRRAGLPGSGGAMRVKGGIKRDSNAASRLAARSGSKPEGRVARLGSRIDPAKQANRKATAKVDRAMATERKAMNVAMRTPGEFTSPARQKANRRLEDAQRETQSLIQTRRNIRAQFGVTTPNKPIRGARPSSTVSSRALGATARNARLNRAQANLARAENRRNYTGKNLSKTRGTAKRALKFMANPRTAIQNRSLGLGFRMPRSTRRSKP